MECSRPIGLGRWRTRAHKRSLRYHYHASLFRCLEFHQADEEYAHLIDEAVRFPGKEAWMNRI